MKGKDRLVFLAEAPFPPSLPPSLPPSFPRSLPPYLPPYLDVARLVHKTHVAELLQLRGVVSGGVSNRHGGRSLREGGREGVREGGGE